MRQYYDKNGLMGSTRHMTALDRNAFGQIYIRTCTKAPVQETDMPPYPFAKIGLDPSGPYPQTLSGNRFILSFIDHYMACPKSLQFLIKGHSTFAHRGTFPDTWRSISDNFGEWQ